MKLKGYFMLIVVILVFFLFYISVIGIKESLTPHLTETQCTQFKTCQDCVATPDSHYGYPCYWNQTKGDCGSFLDEGYSRICPTKESFNSRDYGLQSDIKPDITRFVQFQRFGKKLSDQYNMSSGGIAQGGGYFIPM